MDLGGNGECDRRMIDRPLVSIYVRCCCCLETEANTWKIQKICYLRFMVFQGVSGCIMGQVSKIDAAKRQIDTAIELYFSDGDFLSIYSISFAAHQILNDIYSRHQDDGFLVKLSEQLPSDFRTYLAKPANFLKHADRDHDAYLPEISYVQIEAVLCVATILYRRISGDLTLKMKGFDYVLEEQAYENIGVEEVDTNSDRIKAHAARREWLRNLPDAEMLYEKAKMYRAFVDAFPKLEGIRKQMEAEGKSAVDFLDMLDEIERHHGSSK